MVHYDPSVLLVMAVDASMYGLGAVLTHSFPNRTERLIENASRTLSFSECTNVQVEKKAFALVFGNESFHQYHYGRSFVLITDHKPHLIILGTKRACDH